MCREMQRCVTRAGDQQNPVGPERPVRDQTSEFVADKSTKPEVLLKIVQGKEMQQQLASWRRDT